MFVCSACGCVYHNAAQKSEDGPQVFRLGGKCLSLLTEPSCWPQLWSLLVFHIRGLGIIAVIMVTICIYYCKY